MEKEFRYTIKSANRALEILEACAKSRSPIRIKDLSAALNMGKSNVHRFLASFEMQGYIEKTGDRGEYRLTSKLYELGNESMGALDLISQSSQVCRELNSITRETVHLVVLKGTRAVFVNKLSSPDSFVTYSEIGKTAPAYCIASGKVLLAYLTPSDLEAVLAKMSLKAFTEHTITSQENLWAELEVIRHQGYAIDLEEYERGVCCVAAPIRRFDGQVVAAISVSQLAVNKSEEKWQKTIGYVLEAAAKICKNLGYRDNQQGA